MFVAEVYKTIADRYTERAEAIKLFLETGQSFQEWCLWEAFAACRRAGWSGEPTPSYHSVGRMGSRETADLLIIDPTSDQRVLIELAIVHDWSTNRWLAQLNEDTDNLSRPLTRGIMPLQIILAASLDSPVEVNRVWRSWLEMTAVWPRPTELTRNIPLGRTGEAVIRAWAIS